MKVNTSLHIFLSIILTCFGVLQVQAGNISEVSCSTGEFSNSCTQCFKNDDKLYLGQGVTDFSDTFYNKYSTRVTLLEGDNSNVFEVKSFAPGAITRSNGSIVRYPFSSGENLNDGSYSNGEAGVYNGQWLIRYDAGTNGKILTTEPNSYIKFQNLTQSVQDRGRNKPIFEYSYNFNYNVLNSQNNGYLSRGNKSQECILNYGSWCGDGEKNGAEQCDPNSATPDGYGNGGCSNTCTAINYAPAISIDKIDNNPADRDRGLVDTQLIAYNTNVVFDIKVTNTGDENLKDVRIDDPKAANCSLTKEQTLPLIQAQGNNDDIFDINEFFTYTCSKSNIVLNDTNVATTYGKGVISGVDVNAQDPSPYIIDPSTIPALISIDKTDANPDDLDGGIEDDQTVIIGTGAIFKITLTNTGNDDLINIKVTDDQTPSCDFSLASLIIGDSYDYLCTSEPITEEFTNTAVVTAVGKLSGDTPSDADTSHVNASPNPNVPLCTGLTSTPITGVVPFTSNFACTGNNTSIFDIKVFDGLNTELYSSLTSTGSYNFTNTGTYNVSCFVENQTITTPSCINSINAVDIAPAITIDKVDNNLLEIGGTLGDDTQTVSVGSGATFAITITNSGNEDLNTVIVTDALVPVCNRALDLNVIGNADGIFNVAESFTYNCTDLAVAGGYTNTATGSAIGVISGLPVTDNDTSIVTLPPVPSCDSLTVSQNSGSTPYTPTFNCSATLANAYSVLLTAPNGAIQTFNTSSGTFNINAQGTYSASCFINGGNTTQPACIQTMNYSTGGGGGGSSARCNQGQFTTGSASCQGNSRVTSFQYTCSNGVVLTSPGNNVNFTLADCNAGLTPYDPLNPTVPFDPASSFATSMQYGAAECIAYRGSTQVTRRKACQYDPGGGGGGPRCGDGAVQTYLGEECDGTLGCTSICKLERITYPYASDIVITGPGENYIIGNTMNLYNIHNTLSKPIISNLSTNINADYVIDEICVYEKSGNSLDGTNPQCSSVGILYPQTSVDYRGNITYIGNSDNIPLGRTKDKNQLEYTIKQNGVLYRNAYFAEQFDVTVLKPTITTTGGGTSYVKNTGNLSDTSNLGTTIPGRDSGNNKNFVGASIGDLSSYSKKGINSTEAEADALVLDDDIDSNINGDININWEKYNGINNVYYIKGNKTLNALFDVDKNPVTGLNDNGVSKTYIIEGNLNILRDIEYSGNIAFIVKGGNLKIGNNVKNLKGTYVVIGGEIKGFGGPTTEKLIIKGSIHGKIDDLLSNRTYIKNNSSGLIDVGTIVSFGSSVFRKPAPLTAKFIGEYLESENIAQ